MHRRHVGAPQGTGKLCRNRASLAAPCPSRIQTQTGDYGFCKTCVGEPAALLCLNYTNPRVRCGNRVEQGGRNAVFCLSCCDHVYDPLDKSIRRCKNAAARLEPCSNPAAKHYQGPLHGACHDCAKLIDASASKSSDACRYPMCHNVFDLPNSKYCSKCILDPAKKQNIVLDVRDTDAILSIERNAVSAALPKQQMLPREGDPFYLYLPRKHVNLPSYDPQPNYLPWNHCRLCFETIPIVGKEPFDDALSRHAQSRHNLTFDSFRKVVLETTMHDFPDPITAQVQRTLLDRFRTHLSEENFNFFPCASCVRPFKAADLQSVVFPFDNCFRYLRGCLSVDGPHPTGKIWEGGGKRTYPNYFLSIRTYACTSVAKIVWLSHRTRFPELELRGVLTGCVRRKLSKVVSLRICNFC